MEKTESEEVILLLREIRDLQTLHSEHNKEALARQKVALEVQSKATRLQRQALLLLLIFMLGGLAIGMLSSSLTRH